MSMQCAWADQLPNLLQQPDSFVLLDEPRDYLSTKLLNWARGIDRFFGDERNYQESNASVVQLGLTKIYGYGGEHQIVLSGRAKLHLPSAEKRLHLLLETNPDKNITGQVANSQSTPINQVVAPESYAAAMRYEKEKEDERPWYFSADAGLQFQGVKIDPFVRTRGSYSAPIGEWRINVAESIYWFNTIGTGETTQLDLENFLSETVLFRASSNATWLHEKQNFDLRQDFSLYNTVDERTALLYQISVIGISNPQWQVNDYVALMTYRYRLHKKWIYFEISPQFHFPLELKYEYSPALSVRLEMLFDESR